MATSNEIETTSFEPAHDDAVEQHAEQGCQHQEHEHHRQPDRPPELHRELPVGEGGQHAGGPVGEVEDARRRVGHDQATGDDGVDGGRAQADDGEDEELVHGVEVLGAT
jgi:hypothetical protein